MKVSSLGSAQEGVLLHAKSVEDCARTNLLVRWSDEVQGTKLARYGHKVKLTRPMLAWVHLVRYHK
jgi:hypothetical protein